MSNELPFWRLAAGNGGVIDSSKMGSLKPLQSRGKFDESDDTPIGDFSAEPTSVLPQVQIYQHINFGGHNEVTSLNWYYVGDWWNDEISSIVIYSGRWRFYQHAYYQGAYWDLSPGQYPWVEDANIPNDIISSFKFLGY